MKNLLSIATNHNTPHSASQTNLRFTQSRLFTAIVSQVFLAGIAQAAPSGGTVVGGSGMIDQSGLNTTITQSTDRLAIDWESFNVASNERVAFVQPTETAVALNRILDLNGSQILGRIDANGRVILMNPNGIFFGAGATVNVGSLVATGLNLNTSDFMNGDLLLQTVDGSAGTVINRGIINAATGGNVALIGKQVTNSGLISANLGHVALASGQQAVVSFDDQGLLGVRIDEATLQAQLGTAAGVSNTGTITASGGKILLSGSVSADLFSQAVNSGDMSGDTQAVVYEDGSFSLGASVDVINTGTLDVSSADASAGDVVVVGKNISHRGKIVADQSNGDSAGSIHVQADGTAKITNAGSLSAVGASATGKVLVKANDVVGYSGTRITTSGDAKLSGNVSVRVPTLTAHNLTVSSPGVVRQSGVINVDNVTHLNLTYDADLRFTNAGNDFNVLTMNAGHTSYAYLTDTNDLVLGEMDLEDSTLRAVAYGAGASITQLENSQILSSGSSLYLKADNIALGDKSTSGISMVETWLNLEFAESIHVNNALAMPADFHYNIVSAKGSSGASQINARSTGEFALAATLDEFGGMNIDTMTADTATIASIGEVTQSGAIHLRSALNLNLTAGGAAYLTNASNNFQRVDMNLGHTSLVELVDINDVMLGNMTLLDSTATVTAASMISQLNNTTIDLADSSLNVAAARLYLGDQPSRVLRLHNYSWLNAQYSKSARITGNSDPAGELGFTGLSAKGDFGASQLITTGEGQFSLNASGSDNQITINELTGTDATIHAIGKVNQTGAMHLRGNLHLNLTYDANVELMHEANDFNSISATTAYTSNIHLSDANSITLSAMDLADSNMSVTAAGTIAQAEESVTTLGDSSLVLNGRSVFLNPLADGSGITLHNSSLDIAFTEQVAVANAIAMPGDFNFSYVTVTGTNDAMETLALAQDAPLDLVAQMQDAGGNFGIFITTLNAVDAELTAQTQISQSGPINLSGNLTLNLLAGGEVDLSNPANDFHQVQINSGYTTNVSLTDANDISLGNWDIDDSNVAIHAVGENSTITQAADSLIVGGDSALDLHSANISLGAYGSSAIRLLNAGILRTFFGKTLSLNGVLELGSYYSGFTAEGTAADNTLTIGASASFVQNGPAFFDYSINLLDGNDIIYVLNDLPYSFFTGAGSDQIHLANNDVQYTAEDLDPALDQIVLLP